MALLEEDAVLVSTTEDGTTKVVLPISRANNIEGLGRYKGTQYTVGDTVYVDSNMKIALACITGGVTSQNEIDFTNTNAGETIQDGGVVWLAINRGVFVGASSTTNGASGLVPAPAMGDENKALCGDGSFKTLPIEGGGTGATTAKQALNNLGALPLSGGTMTGAIHFNMDGSETTLSTRNGFACVGTVLDTHHILAGDIGNEHIFFCAYGDHGKSQIIQRGIVPMVNGGTITFPIPFREIPVVIPCIVTTNKNLPVQYEATTTGFTVYFNSSDVENISFIAFGVDVEAYDV